MPKSFIPLTRPTLPKANTLLKPLANIFASGMITDYRYVKQLEDLCAKRLGVKYAVAMSNGTSALLLTLKCLNLKGEVILPSFTYSSGGHVLLWLGLKPVFVDIDPHTFNLDPTDLERKITKRTCAIMPTHVFGNPCAISKIEQIARKHNLYTVYDGAHSFGSRYKNKPLATFGDATIYSFSPTKVFTTGEGGLVATNDKKLADRLRAAKLNGDSFDRSKEFLGYTARMSELQAILGLEALKTFDATVKKRLQRVADYKRLLSKIGGVTPQAIPAGLSTYKDFAVVIDPKRSGFTRDQLLVHLHRNAIQAKVYFYPPLHRKKVYAAHRFERLPVTDYISDHIITLPLYSHMPVSEVKRVCAEITRLHHEHKKS